MKFADDKKSNASGGNGRSGGQSATSEGRNDSGGGIASRIKTAVSRTFVPNAQDLQDRGEPGSALDDAKGFGKGLVNKGVGLINTGINATPVLGFYNHFNPDSQIAVPEVSIANKELPGAFASDVVALVASAFAPSAAARRAGGAVEAGAPSMRQPAAGVGVEDVASSVTYRGGAYGKLDRVEGLERHHMPADSVSPIPRHRGPAIQMDKADHALTSSYGSSNPAKAYRSEIAGMSPRNAMAREVWDVRRIAGSKYNQATREMLSYAKQSGYLEK